MNKLRTGYESNLSVSRPGIFKYLYNLIDPSARTPLLTYLHENETWKLDEVKYLLPVDLASAFHCCNMATDENHEVVRLIVKEAADRLRRHIVKWVKLGYNPKAMIHLISCSTMNELKKQQLIPHLAQRNFPHGAYEAVRGAQRIEYYTSVLDSLCADAGYIPSRKIRLNFLLEVALMLNYEESICFRIIKLPEFRHRIHLIYLALIKKYSAFFISSLLATKGPRIYHCNICHSWNPDQYEDLRRFEVEIQPDLLIKLLRRSSHYHRAVGFYLSFYPEDSALLCEAVQAILKDLSTINSDTQKSIIQQIWIWKHKYALQINRLIAEFAFNNGIRYRIPALKDEHLDAVYSFLDNYTLSEIIMKIHLQKKSDAGSFPKALSDQVILARAVLKRPGGFHMLKQNIGNLHVFYALALFYCQDRSLIKFAMMLQEIQLEKEWNFWSHLINDALSSQCRFIEGFVNYLVDVCESNFGARIVLADAFFWMIDEHCGPEEIYFVPFLTADKWKALINSCDKFHNLLRGNLAPRMFEYFKNIGVMDSLLAEFARRKHIYEFDKLVIKYPVFSSFSEDEKDRADLILQKARPVQSDDEEFVLASLFK